MEVWVGGVIGLAGAVIGATASTLNDRFKARWERRRLLSEATRDAAVELLTAYRLVIVDLRQSIESGQASNWRMDDGLEERILRFEEQLFTLPRGDVLLDHTRALDHAYDRLVAVRTESPERFAQAKKAFTAKAMELEAEVRRATAEAWG